MGAAHAETPGDGGVGPDEHHRAQGCVQAREEGQGRVARGLPELGGSVMEVEQEHERTVHFLLHWLHWKIEELKGILPNQVNWTKTPYIAREIPRNGGDASGRFDRNRGLSFN